MSESKIFKRQSGIIQAVKDDLEEVLEATMSMVEQVENPPLREETKPPVDPGLYRLSGSDHPELTEVIDLSGVFIGKTPPK